MVLIKTDTSSETTLVSSYFLDWRTVLSSHSGKSCLAVELMGVGEQESSSSLFVYITLHNFFLFVVYFCGSVIVPLTGLEDVPQSFHWFVWTHTIQEANLCLLRHLMIQVLSHVDMALGKRLFSTLQCPSPLSEHVWVQLWMKRSFQKLAHDDFFPRISQTSSLCWWKVSEWILCLSKFYKLIIRVEAD